MRYCKYGLIYLSLIFLLGHTFLPHQHHDVYSEDAHSAVKNKEQLSLIELFKLSLTKDLGEDHLRDYKMTDYSGAAFDHTTPELAAMPAYNYTHTTVMACCIENFSTPSYVKRQLATACCSRRGPPSA